MLNDQEFWGFAASQKRTWNRLKYARLLQHEQSLFEDQCSWRD